MQVIRSEFPGLVEFIPPVFEDSRGTFSVTYNREIFKKEGIPDFVQDNESHSAKGVLRGLHFQKDPYAQGKLVRVISGKVQDVVVDLRKGSPTYKQWKSFIISSDIGNQVYVPEGFAHGFLALKESIFAYKCTNIYDKASESGIIWNDPDLDIEWELKSWAPEPIMSDKDEKLLTLDEILEKTITGKG